MFDFLKSILGGQDNSQLANSIKEGALLVDVRTKAEHSSGSVKGSVNIPLDAVSQNLSKFKGQKNIVVFCRSGNRSGQAKSILQQNGINNVINGGTWENVQQVITQIKNG